MRYEELLSHADFMRNLAYSLVLDENRAEDLNQQAWMAALKGAPTPGRAVRPWLVGIIKNLARFTQRSEVRRLKREFVAAVPEDIPSTQEVVEQEEIRNKVVDAVLKLKEPYKSAILLRYYRDLSPTEAARRLNLPTETVKTHLKRGLKKLRAHLDSNQEAGAKDWRLALAPVAGLFPISKSAAASSVLLTVKVKLLLTALLLVLISTLWVVIKIDFSSESNHQNLQQDSKNITTPGQEGDLVIDSDKEPILPEKKGQEEDKKHADQALIVSGKTCLSDGTPVPGAEVKLWISSIPFKNNKRIVMSKEDGSFSMRFENWPTLPNLVKAAARIKSRTSASNCLSAEKWAPIDPDARQSFLEIVLQPGGMLEGKILDQDMAPSPRASLVHARPGATRAKSYMVDDKGCYRIPIQESGVHRIMAIDVKSGVSKILSMDLDADWDGTAPDLILRRFHVIQGHAIYPDGTPIAHMNLFAYHNSQPSYQFRKNVLIMEDADLMRGLSQAKVVTDSKGAFSFACLKPGEFHITHNHQRGFQNIVPTGSYHAVVKLDIYRIKINLKDKLNNPIFRVNYSIRQKKDGLMIQRGNWDYSEEMKDNYFVAQPGNTYHIFAKINDKYIAESTVTIQEGVYETQADLCPVRSKEQGTFEIMVKDPNGKLIPHFSGKLMSAGAQAVFKRFKKMTDGDSNRFFAAPGEYILVVKPRTPPENDYSLISKKITIRSGENTNLILSAILGGRFNLKLYSEEHLLMDPSTLPREPRFSIRNENNEPVEETFPELLQSPLLTPGTYHYFFNALGYKKVSGQVRVLSGVNTEVEIFLEKSP